MAEVMSENPTPEAVAAIVKGLSKAQREAVIRGGAVQINDVGLFNTLTRQQQIRGSETITWNALGLAVRQALTGESA